MGKYKFSGAWKYRLLFTGVAISIVFVVSGCSLFSSAEVEDFQTTNKQQDSSDIAIQNENTSDEGLAELTEDGQQENIDESYIFATLVVGEKKYELEVLKGSSVYDFMNQLKQDTDFYFSGKEYKELGFFTEEINGIKNNDDPGKYWLYSVSGQEAQVGISEYIIQDKDVVVWEYKKM